MEIEIGRNAVDGIRGGAIGEHWNHPWRDQVRIAVLRQVENRLLLWRSSCTAAAA
jgi:hypothetical protein